VGASNYLQPTQGFPTLGRSTSDPTPICGRQIITMYSRLLTWRGFATLATCGRLACVHEVAVPLLAAAYRFVTTFAPAVRVCPRQAAVAAHCTLHTARCTGAAAQGHAHENSLVTMRQLAYRYGSLRACSVRPS
jgi:hypothetical protein